MSEEYGKWKRGCYFDGSFGHYYNSVRIIRFAEKLGWRGTDLELPDTTPDENFDYEWLVEVVDEIEEWLDKHTGIEEGEHWCWSDGDFGLWLFDEDGEHAE